MSSISVSASWIWVAALWGCVLAPSCPAQNATAEDRGQARRFQEDSHSFLQVELIHEESPLGLPEISGWSDRDRARVNLGRALFFDPNLSADGSTSCASCHQPQYGFSIPEPKGKGAHGKLGRRHPPTLINRAFGKTNFWDGRVESLEQQALLPIENELELNQTVEGVLAFLKSNESYRDMFHSAFDDGITRDNLASAIATFERTLLSGNSRIDQFVTARKSTLTKGERQGLWLYESKGRCWQCHSGKTFTDESFHNTGVSWGVEPLDLGRFEVTHQPEHKGQFKTPTLRDVAVTAPYMHDGSLQTLRDVVEFYNQGGGKNPFLDEKMKPLKLSETEKDHLVDFLEALTGQHVWDETGDQPK